MLQEAEHMLQEAEHMLQETEQAQTVHLREAIHNCDKADAYDKADARRNLTKLRNTQSKEWDKQVQKVQNMYSRVIELRRRTVDKTKEIHQIEAKQLSVGR
jgi:hypothetical protein